MPTWASLLKKGDEDIDGSPSPSSSFHPSRWSSVEQPKPASEPRRLGTATTINEKSLALYLLRQHSNVGDPCRLWQALHPDLKLDFDILQAAFEADAIANVDTDLPQTIQQDTCFWQRLLRTNPIWWDHLPRVLQSNPTSVLLLARTMTLFRSQQQVESIVTRFRAALESDVEFWLHVVAAGHANGNILVEMASPEILENKTVMLAAVHENCHVFDLLGAPLNQDRDLVQAALRHSLAPVLYIPAFVQRLYPDLIAGAIARSTKSEAREWQDYIGHDLWPDRRVARAWLSIGGDYLRSRFPVSFKDDRELFLLIAQHNWSEFCLCSPRLRSDKNFMRQAVEKNSMLLWEAQDDLHRDYDLALIAFANSDTLHQSFDMMDWSDANFLIDFWNFLLQRSSCCLDSTSCRH